MFYFLIILIGLIITFVLLKIESDKEKESLSIETVSINSSKIESPLKIVFLCDLHDKEFGEENTRLVSAVNELQPDVILIGGDSMNTRKKLISFAVTDNLLKELSAVAPICYGNGNNEQRMTWEDDLYHEHRFNFIKMLKNYNVNYLDNMIYDIGNVRISGINYDLSHYQLLFYKKVTKDFLDAGIGTADYGKYNVLLAHSPSFLNAYADWGADLVLSGHAHGGIIRFPTDRNKEPGKPNNDCGLLSSQLRLFHKYCAGVFWKGKTCMVVSRGLGTHTVNVRVNNLPQIVVVELKPE